MSLRKNTMFRGMPFILFKIYFCALKANSQLAWCQNGDNRMELKISKCGKGQSTPQMPQIQPKSKLSPATLNTAVTGPTGDSTAPNPGVAEAGGQLCPRFSPGRLPRACFLGTKWILAADSFLCTILFHHQPLSIFFSLSKSEEMMQWSTEHCWWTSNSKHLIT